MSNANSSSLPKPDRRCKRRLSEFSSHYDAGPKPNKPRRKYKPKSNHPWRDGKPRGK